MVIVLLIYCFLSFHPQKCSFHSRWMRFYHKKHQPSTNLIKKKQIKTKEFSENDEKSTLCHTQCKPNIPKGNWNIVCLLVLFVISLCVLVNVCARFSSVSFACSLVLSIEPSIYSTISFTSCFSSFLLVGTFFCFVFVSSYDSPWRKWKFVFGNKYIYRRWYGLEKKKQLMDFFFFFSIRKSTTLNVRFHRKLYPSM